MYILRSDDRWKKEFSETPVNKRRKVKRIKTTTIEPYLKDYSFFILSPLYVFAGIRYSMPDQFEIEAGPQDRILVNYQRIIINGLGAWGKFVEGISNEVWEDFCHYMSTVGFLNLKKRLYWQVRWQDIDLEGTNDNFILNPTSLPVKVRVFLPDGNKGRMFLKAGYPAKVWWDKPHHKIVEAANKLFKTEGKLDKG